MPIPAPSLVIPRHFPQPSQQSSLSYFFLCFTPDFPALPSLVESLHLSPFALLRKIHLPTVFRSPESLTGAALVLNWTCTCSEVEVVIEVFLELCSAITIAIGTTFKQ